jgi:hypothetical protein
MFLLNKIDIHINKTLLKNIFINTCDLCFLENLGRFANHYYLTKKLNYLVSIRN